MSARCSAAWVALGLRGRVRARARARSGVRARGRPRVQRRLARGRRGVVSEPRSVGDVGDARVLRAHPRVRRGAGGGGGRGDGGGGELVAGEG